MRIRWLSLILLLSLTLASCAPSEAEPRPSAPREVPSEAPSQALSPVSTKNPLPLGSTPVPQETPSNPPPVEKLVSLVTKDLAERLHIDPDEIVLVKTTERIWPNAALGCPSPGKVYAQGKVSGYQIRLEAENKEYFYHTDRTGQFILCLAPDLDIQVSPEIPVTPGEIDDGQPWVPVD